MRFTTSQTNFKAGRLSPKLANRIDTEQYRAGASILQSVRIIPEGGVERSRGTRILPHTFAESIDAADVPQNRKMFNIIIRGIPLLVIIARHGAPSKIGLFVHKFPYDYATSNATPKNIVPPGSHQYDCRQFDYTVSNDCLIITHADGTFAPLYVFFDSTAAITSLETQYTILADTTANGAAADTSVPVNCPFEGMYPMLDIGTYTSLLTIGAWDNVLKRFVVTGAGNAAVISLLQASRVIYLEGLGRKDFGDGLTRTVVAADFFYVVANHANGVYVTPRYQWQLNAGTPSDILNHTNVTTVTQWSVNMWKAGNFPRSVTSHESRVVFGGTPSQPLTYFGSRTANDRWFNQIRMLPSGCEFLSIPSPVGSTLATDAFVFKAAVKEDSRIMWVASASELVIGTDRREYVVTGGDSIISPFSINMKPYSAKGGDVVSAASIGEAVYYTANAGKKLFRFQYNSSNGTFVSQEVSLLFSDLIEYDTIAEVVWATHLSTLYVRMSSGQVYGIYDDGTGTPAVFDTKLTGVLELAYIKMGGFDESAVYPNRGDHLVGMFVEGGLKIIEQTVGEGSISGYPADVEIEIIDANAYKYMDDGYLMIPSFGGTWKSWNNKTIAGPACSTYPVPLAQFPTDTEIIACNLNTGVMKTFTVGASDATFTGYWLIPDTDFDVDAGGESGILVGVVPRVFEVATMPIEAGQQWGTAQMGIKNIDTVGFRYYKTYSFEFSSNGDKWQEVNVTVDGGKCATGRIDRKYDTRPNTDQIVHIRNAKCEPCCIIGVNMRGTSNDG